MFQKIYQNNRTRGGYSLTELELPGTRTHRNLPTSVLQEMATSVALFFGSFFQLFNVVNLKRTLLLFAAWMATIFIYHGLTIYIAEYSKSTESENYYRNTVNLFSLTISTRSYILFSHYRSIKIICPSRMQILTNP